MVWQIEMTIQARNDLDKIINYLTYTLMSPQAAKTVLQLLDKQLMNLESYPYMGKLYKNSKLPQDYDIRWITFGQYLFFYHIQKSRKVVVVLRIGHMRQDKRLLFKEIKP